MVRINNKPSKRWTFTRNITSTETNSTWRMLWTNVRKWHQIRNNKLTYIVCQQEKGISGTLHIQGYIEFKTRQKRSRIKNSCLGRTTHCEQAISGWEENTRYCSKEETRVAGTTTWTWGNPDIKVKKTLSEIVEIITGNNCPTLQEIAMDNGVQWVLHHGGLESLREKSFKKRHEDPILIIKYGDSGTGKSYLTDKEYPNAYYINPRTGENWFWNGYDGEKVVVIDDFRDNNYTYLDLMNLINCAPFVVNMKHSKTGIQCQATTIIILTNQHPKLWYPGVPNTPLSNGKSKEPLQRRIRMFGTLIEYKGLFDANNPDAIQKTIHDAKDFTFKI